jgi:LmbE family N-acetylglucosaminyl deacetylase
MEHYLKNSLIVVAHPDDEVLWFSSILSQVDGIICCFSDVASQPQWTEGRKKSLSDYPLDNLSSLNIPESEAFDHADWTNPNPRPFGLDVSGHALYENNYNTLKEKLSPRLKGVQSVFTHNPWGEYGHEEHVQVYRVVNELRQTNQFDLWYSNYCSNKTARFMLDYQQVFSSQQPITLTTDKVLSKTIQAIYEKNGCWTWYSDWRWPEKETFFKDASSEKAYEFGKIAPINLINVELPKKKNKKPGFIRRVVARLYR